MEPETLTPIQEFYKDAEVFITGVTGFLGHLLLEKLWRACPHISKIYVLVRTKKGKDMTTRIDEMLDNVLFEQVKKQYPHLRNNIVGIAGDCSLYDLGMSIEDRKLLTEKVTIVFHGAATVRFDENLKTATYINMRGTEDILKLAKEMKKLKSFIYISTLFANCPNRTIKEIFYPPAYGYQQMMNIVDNLPPRLTDLVTPELLGDYPNTYTITKQIAESVVQTVGQGLPLGVFRPSIVLSTYREPLKGWINNFYGPTGYAGGAGAGLIRVGKVDVNCKANMVPADMTVNFLIAAAWDVAKKFSNEGEKYEMEIYNYDCGDEQYMTWKRYMNRIASEGVNMGSLKCIWYYSLTLVTNHYLFLILEFFLHTTPAALVDLVRICIGKPPMMMKVYKKIRKFTEVIEYFSTHSWDIRIDNYKRVCNSMSPQDKELFFCDLKYLDWDDFLVYYMFGVRVYLFNDPLETLEEGKKKYRKLYWLHQAVKTVILLLFAKMLWSIFYCFINKDTSL